MLVPIQGGVAALQKRNRTINFQKAALGRVKMGHVYIYNVGPRQWRGVGGGKEWVVPACPKGQRYSSPISIPELNLSEVDLADGGNNMGTLTEPAESGLMDIGGQEMMVAGVADDVIGLKSTTPGLELNTTNGQWFGVFASRNEEDGEPVPLEEEIEEAESKLRQMAQLVYQTGSEKVGAGEKVSIPDRHNYNWAASLLGVNPLWGNLDHTMATCPECGEDIRKGAKVCKHCGKDIDHASVAARQRKREKEAAKMLKEVEGQEVGE